MATQEVVNRYWQNIIMNSPDDVAISSNGNGFDLTRAGWSITDEVRFNEIDSSTNNPKLQIQVNWTTVQTIDLNKNDIQIDNAGSDFDLTDDSIRFNETNGDSVTISFAKYNVTSSVNSNWNIEITQNGSILTTINQGASGITFNASWNSLTWTDVQSALEELNTKVDTSTGGTEQQDDFVATVGQTAFTLTQTPNGQVNIIRNGITLRKAAISVTWTTATYVPAQNGNNSLVAWDAISFTYQY